MSIFRVEWARERSGLVFEIVLCMSFFRSETKIVKLESVFGVSMHFSLFFRRFSNRGFINCIVSLRIVCNIDFFQGNYAKFLKNLHSEQITKLQAKNQHECDLLEDIRQFTIKRSAIEKSYSEVLKK